MGEEKNVGAGRPTDYRAEYGGEIIALMATGLSLTAAAADLGFGRSTVYQWIDRHPEFADAVNLGRAKRMLVLERQILNQELPGPAVTARIFALKNADRWDREHPERVEWADTVRQEHTGRDGGPIEHELRVEGEAADVLAALTGTLSRG